MSFPRPFSEPAWLAAAAVAALTLLASAMVLPARAQAAQQPAVSGGPCTERGESAGSANRHRGLCAFT